MSSITERLADAVKLHPYIEDQSYSLVVDSLAEIERLKARVATLELAAQSDEPDLVWDYENQQDPGYEPQKIVDTLADRMNSGESQLFAVACAKRMPNREMQISVSDEGEVSWQWVEQPKEKDDE